MKALALFSGGLDSTLAIKLVEEQGIEIVAVHFYTKFFSKKEDPLKNVKDMAKQINVRLKIIDVSSKYLKVLKKPKHGYGSGVNPCIDCKIFMLKQARNYAKKINAKFIFTGEVVGERPMSQNRKALGIIEKEAGLSGKLLRPLSAKVMDKTIAEKKGWINREKLYGIVGRNRQPQLTLAKKYNIKNFPSPAGGCLLCENSFSRRFFDLSKHQKRISVKDVELLKYGRHFRFEDFKIIVGRDEYDNNIIKSLKLKSDFIFEVPNIGSPITLLKGKKTNKSIIKSAELTAAYSDVTDNKVEVNYGSGLLNKKIIINYRNKKEFTPYLI